MADISNQNESSPVQGNEQSLVRILVVEDDHVFRKLLMRMLERKGYHVREAENGLVAKTIFDLDPKAFQIVISDIRMPEVDGLGLLTHVHKTAKIPFIMMTGFSEILEVMDAHSLGAREFLAKPFNMDALFSTIDLCLKPEPVAEQIPKQEVPPHQEYCRIHIDEFISASQLLSDIFIKLSENKYVKVAYKGEAIPIERLRTYQEKQVQYLYVTVGDFSHYVDFNINLTQIIGEKKILPNDRKAKLLTHTTELIVQRCFVEGIDRSMLAPAQQMVEDTMKLIAANDDALSLLDKVSSHSDRLYAHAVAVSLYSCLLAREHGWTSSNSLFKVAIGGLFHDVGLKELNPSFSSRPRADLSYEEVMELETHPLRSRDILTGIRGMPDEIALIAQHHHESPNGTGYPLRLKGEEIHPIARLIKIVDLFCDLVLPSHPSQEALNAQQAVQRMYEMHEDEIDETFLNRLKFFVTHGSTPKSNSGTAKKSA